jgi:hypothetical protein
MTKKASTLDVIHLIAYLPQTVLERIQSKGKNKLLQFCIKNYSKLSSLSTSDITTAIYGYDTTKHRDRVRGNGKNLKKKIEKEVVLVQLEQEKLYQQFFFIKYLSKLKVSRFYFKCAKELVDTMERRSVKGIEEYNILSIICRDIYYHPDHNKFNAPSIYLDKSVFYREKYVLLSELSDAVEYVGISLNKEQNSWSRTKVEKLLQDTDTDTDEVLLTCYSSILRLQLTGLSNNDQSATSPFSHLEHTYQLLEANAHHLPTFDWKLLCSKLIQLSNYAIERFDYRKSKLADRKQLTRLILQVYQLQDKYSLILYKDRMTFSSYVTVMAIASSLHQFKWCDYYKDKYQKYLSISAEDALALADAYLCYYQQNYTHCLQLIEQIDVNKKSLFFKAHGRILTIYCLYELFISADPDKYDELSSKIANAKAYFRRDTFFSTSKRKAFKNTVTYAEKLIQYVINPNRKKEEGVKLEEAIIDTYPVVAKHWLLEKLAEATAPSYNKESSSIHVR